MDVNTYELPAISVFMQFHHTVVTPHTWVTALAHTTNKPYCQRISDADQAPVSIANELSGMGFFQAAAFPTAASQALYAKPVSIRMARHKPRVGR
jgi:hypothetical protein